MSLALPTHTHALPRAAGSGGFGTTVSWTTIPCPSGTSGVACPVTSVLPTSAKMDVLSSLKVGIGSGSPGHPSCPGLASNPKGPREEESKGLRCTCHPFVHCGGDTSRPREGWGKVDGSQETLRPWGPEAAPTGGELPVLCSMGAPHRFPPSLPLVPPAAPPHKNRSPEPRAGFLGSAGRVNGAP